MSEDIQFNPGYFGVKIKKLFENYKPGDDTEEIEDSVEEDTEGNDVYDELEDAANDVKDAVSKIQAASDLEDDGVIDFDTHKVIEDKASEELESAKDKLEDVHGEWKDRYEDGETVEDDDGETVEDDDDDDKPGVPSFNKFVS